MLPCGVNCLTTAGWLDSSGPSDSFRFSSVCIPPLLAGACRGVETVALSEDGHRIRDYRLPCRDRLGPDLTWPIGSYGSNLLLHLVVDWLVWMGTDHGGYIRCYGHANTGLNHRGWPAACRNLILGVLTEKFTQTYFRRSDAMFKLSDIFILLAVIVSFAVSGYLWFNGFREQGIFTAIWVPSILAFGIYFKLSVVAARSETS